MRPGEVRLGDETKKRGPVKKGRKKARNDGFISGFETQGRCEALCVIMRLKWSNLVRNFQCRNCGMVGSPAWKIMTLIEWFVSFQLE